jgi:alcohol dehydrogenase class IV
MKFSRTRHSRTSKVAYKYCTTFMGVVVAIGGGSSLDCAKAICCLARNPAPLSNYAGYHKIPNPGLPLIAVPTTSGTGGEATKVAVITNTRNNVKMIILDDHLLPLFSTFHTDSLTLSCFRL